MTMPDRIIAFLKDKGESSLKDIVAALGKHLNQASARNRAEREAGRRRVKPTLRRGQTRLMQSILRQLDKAGRISRPARGRYAFNPSWVPPARTCRSSLIHRVREFVLGRGICTIGDVVKVLGGTISASRAAREAVRTAENPKRSPLGRRVQSTATLVRRMLIAAALGKSVRRGELRRVSLGVYGPPLSKIHQPSQAG